MANNQIGSIPYSLSLHLVNPGDAESAKKIAATLQSRETIGLRLLAKHMANHATGISEGTIYHVLADMVNCTLELLKSGYSVDLDGLAKFYLTCKSDMADTIQEFSTSMIKAINIRTSVDENAKSEVNTDVDYEYVMTREEQAAAKKAAKANLPQEETTDDGGSGSGSGGDPGVTE